MNRAFNISVIVLGLAVLLYADKTAPKPPAPPAQLTAVVHEQYVVAVWDGDCLKTVAKGPHTRFEVPLDANGKPDWDKSSVSGVVIDIKNDCERLEVRHK